MNLQRCFLTKNECYQKGKTITPRGVMVHSTGANNPNLKRYVQPDDGKLGSNNNGNHWNQWRPDNKQVCVHAFIGKLADGSIATYQTLPWNMRAWHCAGDGNNTHIAFEICEDGLSNAAYFGQVYREAVELTAYLCKTYGLDPTKDGVVICHSEGASRGIASNHGDVMHWFPKHGKNMDTFRADVKKEMEGEDDMTKQEVIAIINEQAEKPYNTVEEVPDWGKATIEKLVRKGYLQGENGGLGLTNDLLRTLVINDRAGIYGE